ncbi:MAG TPA: heme-binding protein [Candidatus Aquilonibacter sp.]|jgi:hypothetical protein|nr:heme-binding protein [Candidatus Aquilonibacter sp.]
MATTIENPTANTAATNKVSSVPPRFQQGPITTALQLGPLAPLAGNWKGRGFNVMWRPDNPQSPPFGQTKRFLELNLTSETLDFHVIPGVVPNRGLNPQPDLSLYGLHYLQRVTDADKPPFSTAGQALHIEPGLFMNVPASQEPAVAPSIVRMASIPHGVSLLMQGPTPSTTPVAGPPKIPAIYPIAGMPSFTPPAGALGLGIQPVDIPKPASDGLEHVVPEVTLASDGAGSQSNGPYPPSIPQAYVNDPNSILREAIAGQDILGTITIQLSTTGAGSGIENIPFLGTANPSQASAPTNANAFVLQSEATFWIEWVRIEGYPDSSAEAKSLDPRILGIEPFWPAATFLQLQYSQVSILVFNNVLWPHVNVATLTLSAG